MHKIIIINGPNLNLLGKRDDKLYGQETLGDIKKNCINTAKKLTFSIDFYQTNSESNIINLIHESMQKSYRGLIINAGGYTHTSIAIMDALLVLDIPIIEVHLSNIFKREEFRQKSYTAQASIGLICGFGGYGYELALHAIHNIINS